LVTEGIIRVATEADLEAITAIYNDAILMTTASWDDQIVGIDDRRRWLAEHATEPNVTLVAEIDGEVVGFAGYGSFREKAGYDFTVEHSVYLAPEAQGRGLGTRLLSELIEAAAARGIHVMIGGLSADNDVSLKLHQRLGFVETARMPQVGKKFGRWLDLVFVQLVLDDRRRPGDPLPTE
jgi:L-amino acid N-acyltransferase YncA